MNLKHQSAYEQGNRLAQHIGFEDFDSVPESRRSEILTYAPLLGQLERDFFTAIMHKYKADLMNIENSLKLAEQFANVKL